MMNRAPFILTDAQLRAEIAKCEYCAEKPCRSGCPADCSPADFIMAAKVGEPADFARAAALVMAANPLGGVCGEVCPDTFCMRECARRTFDQPVNIPAVQATIVAKARELGVMPEFGPRASSERRVAVIGSGPAGCGAATVLAQEGCTVDLIERAEHPGGMAALIPEFRLEPRMLTEDIEFVASLGAISRVKRTVDDPAAMLGLGYHAVVVATGLDVPIALGIPGEECAVGALAFLRDPSLSMVVGHRVAVIGGGAVAADCAETAVRSGATQVELFALETIAEMPLTPRELQGLLHAGVQINGRVRVLGINSEDGAVAGLRTRKVALPKGATFHPSCVVDLPGTEQERPDIEVVIVAIGARSSVKRDARPGIFFAGDLELGPTTVVEAVAAGKNAALRVLEYLGVGGSGLGVGGSPTHAIRVRGGDDASNPEPQIHNPKNASAKSAKVKSTVVLHGLRRIPVQLDTDFFGTPIASPFLLSAAPPSDGYEQMKKAYEAGWAGGVMKTAFDDVPIHIPSRYMFSFDRTTFANCDNVSGHRLERVCGEIERLRREFADRLTLASTGGPVTGHDEVDARVWQSNTRKLERAGAYGIEYSLSCPQGGDGTKGDIVSQDAELTAKIIGWVLATGDLNVPKLFKLTAAVTSIYPIITAIKGVFARFPSAKAGVTLANTFPTLAFRAGEKRSWDEGIVVGMSGAGVIPISNLTLANVSRLGVTVSGNGGPMDYRAAANFLALGARTVQFCSIVMKYGVGIVEELHSGLSHLLQARGLRSVSELIGCALPDPITGFMDLSAVKSVSTVERDLCVRCGNCTRCPYLAITLDDELVPATDPSRCVGCSFCAQQCFAGALTMRARTPEEAAALVET